MRLHAVVLLSALTALGLVPTQTGANQTTAVADQPARAVALTFDDLPYVPGGQANDLAAARRATTAILRVLAAHRAPAVGFVNEGKLQVANEVEARIALLRQWVDAGAILGNHTYSHVDFNTVTAEEFKSEIARGDVVTRQLMNGARPYQLYFRHPQTHTGDTLAKKEAVERYLAARGYVIAPHTIETADFIFNVGYVRSLRAGDRATAERLRRAYVDFALAATAFAEQISPQIFGRDIPQTMLLHANDVTADTLDELLQRLGGRGYRFITLDQAMADAAYRTEDTMVTKHGPTWLWRWIRTKGLTISGKGDPEPPQWVMDLYASRVP